MKGNVSKRRDNSRHPGAAQLQNRKRTLSCTGRASPVAVGAGCPPPVGGHREGQDGREAPRREGLAEPTSPDP